MKEKERVRVRGDKDGKYGKRRSRRVRKRIRVRRRSTEEKWK